MPEIGWPVFEFITNFVRQVKHRYPPAPEQARYEAISALRDAEELARDDPSTERSWNDHIKPMLVYFVDYIMLNSDWDGRDYWFDTRMETDPAVLDHVEALGGERFFEDCDQIQRDYEEAERRDRRDKDRLAGLLELYYICLRLGFKGKYHDYPQELADYTRRLFTRLPAYSSTRQKILFPQAYQERQTLKVDYKLGMSLTFVLVVFAMILIGAMITFRAYWATAVGDLDRIAGRVQETQMPALPGDRVPEARP